MAPGVQVSTHAGSCRPSRLVSPKQVQPSASVSASFARAVAASAAGIAKTIAWCTIGSF